MIPDRVKYDIPIIVVFPDEVRCDHCGGSGKEPSAITTVNVACDKCNGNGKLRIR